MKPVGVRENSTAGNADQPDIDHEHDGESAHESTRQVSVAGGEPVEAAIEAIEAGMQQPPARPGARERRAGQCALKARRTGPG